MAESPLLATPPPMAGAESKSTAPQLSALNSFLKSYTPAYIESGKDSLDGRWRIDIAAPLAEYDTKTARAYAATDLIHPDKKLFALVCRPGTYQRHRIIPTLKTLRHPNLMALMAAGAVELSQPQEERFVLFYERPPGKKLSQLLTETNNQLNETFIARNIIAPIVAAIHELSERDITHGRINLDNIYYHNTPILGDCVSEACGYSQPYYYEPLERMQAHTAAKGEANSAVDYYALAILVLHLQHGKQHFAGWTQEMLINTILRGGSYSALMGDKENSVMFEEFFRGLLAQKVEDRWGQDYLRQWLDGKRFNVLTPSVPTEAIRPFELGNYQANTKRELAHLLYTNWINIPEILNSGQLTQWIFISLRNKELADTVTRISNSIKEIGNKNAVQLNEQLVRLLVLFDPSGPIRIKPLSMHADGIDALYTELFASKAENELQLMAKFIEFNMVNFWFDQQRKIADYKPTVTINNALTKLDRLRISIRNTGMGFGLERVLYDLNPEMPCLSPLLSNHHVNNLPTLLKRLDALAPRMAGSQDPIDRHIAAYIASKMNIQHEIKLHELANVPALSTHRSIIALRLLAMAQQRAVDAPLPGLAHWLGTRILPALETLRSKTLRKTLILMLVDRIESGRLSYMAELLIDSNYATADRDGYNRAMQTYRMNTGQIASLRNGDGLNEKSSALGYSIAKIFASIAFILTLLSLVKEWSN